MKLLTNKLLHHPLILLLIIYFSLHLINLTLLPIFNDESGYLDWAWSYTHMPGHLFDSLLDAKQPLMIWIFAIFENIFDDPLFAGRFASVLIGALSLAGIFKLTKKIADKHTAFLAALLYAITPIFVFYNRQALLEAGISCIGIWTCSALLDLIHKNSTRNAIMLGIYLGLGFLIKSSGLLFIASATLILFAIAYKKRQWTLLKSYIISLTTFFCINLLIFINPLFWEGLSLNNRFGYTPSELLSFPLKPWLIQLRGFLEIGFFFISPFTFLAGLAGIISMWKNGKDHKIPLTFFLISLALEIFMMKSQSQRYIVAFLPFLIITASFFFKKLLKENIIKKSIVIISLIIPFLLSLFLVLNPAQYILQLSRITSYADTGYILGQTSGYGVNEAIQYIKDHASQSSPNMVFFGLNVGNPESAVDLYSQRDPRLYSLHMDSQFFPQLIDYKCLSSQYPAFFVARNDQLVGMDKYFSLAKSFPNPYNKYAVQIYTLTKNCNGETTSLSALYQGAIDKINVLRE